MRLLQEFPIKVIVLGREKESYGLGLGIRTPLGPGYLGVAKSPGENVRYFLNFGYDPKSFNEN